MTHLLEECFSTEMQVLVGMFGRDQITKKLPRLNEIHQHTEAMWRDYLKRLQGRSVRYLLIAEAPPWSDSGVPQYVLDPKSRSRTLMKALRGAFLSPASSRQLDGERALAEFAAQGLLVVDSIPFAMDYLKSRSRLQYGTLVGLTVHSYLRKKLLSSSLSFSAKMRIAFSVKKNAVVIMKALGPQLVLGKAKFVLIPEQIAVNDAGYPDAGKLRYFYGLEPKAD